MPTQADADFSISNTSQLFDIASSPGAGRDAEENLTVVKQCVEGNADVSYQVEEGDPTILHMFAKHACLRSFELCLETPRQIDFAAVDALGQTLFHALCSRCYDGTQESKLASKQMFAMVDQRLKSSIANDRIKWNRLDNHGDDVLSCAAMYGMLHIVWPIASPAFPQPRITLREVVSESDWRKLAQAQGRFEVLNGVVSDPTATLLALQLRRTSTPEAMEAIKRCIVAGADVTYRKGRMSLSALHYFIMRERTQCVVACLQSPRSIDFTAVDERGNTPQHAICLSRSSANTVAMMDAVLQRLQRPPHGTSDVVNWELRNDRQLTVLGQAARQQILYLVWPLLKTLHYFHITSRRHRASMSLSMSGGLGQSGAALFGQSTAGLSGVLASGAIPLNVVVSDADWAMLSVNDQQQFVPLNGIASPSTAALVALAQRRQPSPVDVQRCVMAGADVTYKKGDMILSPLHSLIYKDCLECVRFTMLAITPVDFTVTGPHGETPLHAICTAESESTAVEMLRTMVDRIALHPDTDTINWKQKDNEGRDFLEFASQRHLWEAFWPLVEPYCSDT